MQGEGIVSALCRPLGNYERYCFSPRRSFHSKTAPTPSNADATTATASDDTRSQDVLISLYTGGPPACSQPLKPMHHTTTGIVQMLNTCDLYYWLRIIGLKERS